MQAQILFVFLYKKIEATAQSAEWRTRPNTFKKNYLTPPKYGKVKNLN